MRRVIKFSTMYTYDTVTAAVKGLKERGYTKDFNLKENCLVCHEDKFHPEDFEITEVYRFEGNSDPGDEAVVYAIESNKGDKGVLVSGYGISADEMTSEMAKKLSIRVH
ncbi:MAG: phosphoribosylpyrophosphate synthetase [Chitinophagales bacterium]